MATPEKRRRVARVTIREHLTARLQPSQEVRLIDLSVFGARIEQSVSVPRGARRVLELPPAFRVPPLAAEVVWTVLSGGERTPEGEQKPHYQSGLMFVDLTAEQEAALAEVVNRLAPEGRLPQDR